MKQLLSKIKTFFRFRTFLFLDMLKYYLRLTVRSGNSNEIILFICESNMPRLGRMTKFLSKHRKEQFVVLVAENKFYKHFIPDNDTSQYITYRNRYDLKAKIESFNHIKLIHGIESRSVYPSVAADYPEYPFVYDFQDLYVNYSGMNPKIKWIKHNLQYEKTCLTHASHLIAYSLEYISARKLYGIEKKPLTYFPFYLDDDLIFFKDKKMDENNIRLVYAGGISPVERNDSFNLSKLGAHLLNTNVYLHIYPSPTTPSSTVNGYLEFSRTNPHLVLHSPIPQSQLSSELSSYDFGIIPFFKVDTWISDIKFRYSTTLKLTNYIESGLPVLVMKNTAYQAWMVDHYKLGISLEDSELPELESMIRKIPYEDIRHSVKSYQNEHLLSENILKISRIYDDLIANR